MNAEPAISVDHAAKKFAKRLNKSMLYGIQDVARDVVGLSTRPDRLRPEEFWAVDDVSFELKQGDTLGIVGPNGSGKSTLLKMLNGIIYPDRGRLSVCGRVGALIEVGAGFHPMLTGRENIFVNGAILGMSKAEIKGKFDAIVDFAEIGEFIDMPVKNYSSGMYVRLGFAVAAHCEPDILLVDEILAVGDASFRARSFRFIEERVLRRGVIMCLVSHNIHAVTRLCSQALLFDKGAVRYLGDSAGVVKHYYELMRPVCPANGRAARHPETREGAGQVCVERVLLRDRQGKATDSVEAGSPLEVEIHLGVKADMLAMPRVGLKISDLSGVVIVYAFMREERRRSICLKRGRLILRCRFEGFSAMPGRYTMDVKVGGADDLLQDILRDAAVVTVTGSDRLYESTANAGMVYFVNNWDCEQQLR